MAKGYTRIDNDLIEGLAKLKVSGATLNVLLAIIRNTLSYHKIQHELSNSFLMKATNSNESTVIRAIQELEKRKIIEVVKGSNGSHPKQIRILTGNIATLAKTEGGTGNSASESTGKNDSENTGNSAREETKELNKELKERERNAHAREDSLSEENELSLEELAKMSQEEEDE
jgi:phage replication O-like protein O